MSKLCVLGADHAGLTLLKDIEYALKSKGYEILKFAPKDVDSKNSFDDDDLDYPDFATMACKEIRESSIGVLICGSGIGMSIAANRFPFIRAALCTDTIMARLCREHNDANVLCLGQRLVTKEVALEILDVFLETKFSLGRHIKRVDKLCKCGFTKDV